MDDIVISRFDTRYYVRATVGAISFLWPTGYMLYHCLLGDFVHPGSAYIITLILLASLWVYYHFFSPSWKQVTVTATEVVIYDVVFKKQTIINVADITHTGTYRTRGSSSGSSFSQSFVIEYGHDKYVSFNEAWYENYDRLTMALYNHKYGPGHGRERYLERHQK